MEIVQVVQKQRHVRVSSVCPLGQMSVQVKVSVVVRIGDLVCVLRVPILLRVPKLPVRLSRLIRLPRLFVFDFDFDFVFLRVPGLFIPVFLHVPGLFVPVVRVFGVLGVTVFSTSSATITSVHSHSHVRGLILCSSLHSRPLLGHSHSQVSKLRTCLLLQESCASEGQTHLYTSGEIKVL